MPIIGAEEPPRDGIQTMRVTCDTVPENCPDCGLADLYKHGHDWRSFMEAPFHPNRLMWTPFVHGFLLTAGCATAGCSVVTHMPWMR